MSSSLRIPILDENENKVYKKKKENTQTRLKMWRVQRHSHHETRNHTRSRQSNDPSRKDESDLLPVDSLYIKVAQGNTDGGTSQTLRGRHRKSETRSQKDGNSGAEFHGETTGRRDLSDLVAEGAHNVVAVEPEAEAEEQTSDDEDPDGGVGFLGDDAGGVGVVRAYPGTDCVGDCEDVS